MIMTALETNLYLCLQKFSHILMVRKQRLEIIVVKCMTLHYNIIDDASGCSTIATNVESSMKHDTPAFSFLDT